MTMTQVDKPQRKLQEIVAQRFDKSVSVPEMFFASEAAKISQVCLAMAKRFHQGGRILAFGNGACATDAHHIAVEFVHPVIVGKRALPALALTNDSATLTACQLRSTDTKSEFQEQLKVLARPADMALGFSPDGKCENVLAAMKEAQVRGLLTLGFAGQDGGFLEKGGLDFCFTVKDNDPFVIQETHETLYHILWELVHVFFEHEGLLE